jgi:hypothetical protein
MMGHGKEFFIRGNKWVGNDFAVFFIEVGLLFKIFGKEKLRYDKPTPLV